MARLNLFDFTDHLLAASMKVLATRHELLSANIANVDTPGYRRRDIDFAAVMRALTRPENSSPRYPLGGRIIQVSGAGLNFFHPELFSSVSGTESVPDPSFLLQASASSYEAEGKLDQNSVDLDREIALLSENSLLYETNLTLLSKKLGQLQYAISEGKR